MFNRGGPKAGLTVDNKYHKTTNVTVTALGHFWDQISQTQNWTVLTYMQLLVFHCWERLHTVNMETTDSNILSQLSKETHREILKPNADSIHIW